MGNPKLIIDMEKIRSNIREVTERCNERGISVAGVMKGLSGLPEVSVALEQEGCDIVASSRLPHLRAAREAGVSVPLMLIRIPMMSEAEEVIETADISLDSDIDVLKALNEAAMHRGKAHGVILMADIGDLREGFWGNDELADAAEQVEKEMPGLRLLGVGTNIGCYGSVFATAEKLQELVTAAEAVEERIGRRLEIISGGATSSFMRVEDGTIPDRINQLRIGEGILMARDWKELYGFDYPNLQTGTVMLEAEVIEVRDKPSYPVGELTFDAFGNKPEYEDRGIRKKALLAAGNADYGYYDKIYPLDKGIEVLGASSDHTVLDVTDASRDIKTGDTLLFDLEYATMLMLSHSPDVEIEVMD
ncbi:MAG: alanine racemase [Anaerovoracaceae bacterium]|jgi:predicted amino acid racemase